ncbi:MAG TPA: type II toxin-antitoxin system prevent-host-death family antitoxin [Polyangiales bacterium]|nr:type II toxin-antitoxin system prevent-host-death family antitoxin [Polyangiales bacterium]
MVKKTYGAEEARTLLPELLERAHHGTASLITRRGKPYAAIVSVQQAEAAKAGVSILELAGTGRGLWGRNAAASVARLRDEWS